MDEVHTSRPDSFILSRVLLNECSLALSCGVEKAAFLLLRARLFLFYVFGAVEQVVGNNAPTQVTRYIEQVLFLVFIMPLLTEL